MTLFGIALASLLSSLALTPLVRRAALKNKTSVGVIPRFGGTTIFISFSLPLLVLSLLSTGYRLDNSLRTVLLGSLIVLIVGIYDDLKGASVASRLVVEVGAACMIYFAGIGIHSLPNPFGAPLALGWLSLPVTVLWVVVITNAINLIDGLDGLAAGTSILILAAILLLNWQALPIGFSLAAFALIGALAGFLVFNFPSASIYMGDSGSLFLGFFLAAFTMAVSKGTTGSSTIGVMVLAFSLPLLDMVYAVLRRWYRGMPIYKSDTEHLHHKLLQKGFSKRQVLSWFYGANLLLLIVIFLLFKVHLPRALAILILVLLSLTAFWGFQLLSDLKPTDFIRKIGLLFADFKKRRYHLYLINHFEKKVEKEKDFAEISRHLDELFRDYGFSDAQIENRTGKVYTLAGNSNEMNGFSLEFPLLESGVQLARVRLRKPLESGPIYCSGELAQVLSSCLVKVIPHVD